MHEDRGSSLHTLGALRQPHIRLLPVARFPLALESVVGIAGIQPGPDIHRMSRRSLVADSSLTLRVTSATYDSAPSQDLIFSVFQQLSPLQSPIACAVISLSFVTDIISRQLSRSCHPSYSTHICYGASLCACVRTRAATIVRNERSMRQPRRATQR